MIIETGDENNEGNKEAGCSFVFTYCVSPGDHMFIQVVDYRTARLLEYCPALKTLLVAYMQFTKNEQTKASVAASQESGIVS